MNDEFQIPDKTYTKLLEKYRPSTIKTFITNIKRILRDAFNTNTFTLQPLVNTVKTKKYLESIQGSGMRKTLLATIIAFLKTDPAVPPSTIKFYSTFFDTLAKQVNHERQYQCPTPEEQANWISWPDIIKKRKKYRRLAECVDELQPSQITLDDKYLYLKYILLCLYTYIPPLRGEEYINATVISVANPKLYQTVRDITGRNLFDVKHKQFVVYGYKTSNVYGTRFVPIPDELIPIIKRWTNLTNSQLLLPNLQDPQTPILQESLTQLFFRIFEPKNVSTRMLRKIYISHKLKTLKDPEKRKELALVMGHSLQTQEFIYSCFKNQ